jgi:ABC-type antimicrobial peptide transport system permease subunit
LDAQVTDRLLVNCGAVAHNKLRSTLAAISVMIGVGAVVCDVAIGKSGSQRAEEQLQNPRGVPAGELGESTRLNGKVGPH